MRRYGMYDSSRGLMTALAVAAAGLLLWVATQVGVQTTPRFWAAMGIVAAAGLVVTLLPALGGSVHGAVRLRLSPGTFLLGFLPTLVVVGWILMATQPGGGWHEGTVAAWSRDIGVMGLVHALGLWHGALAFGFGAVLGMSLDTVPAIEPAAEETVVDRRAPGPRRRRRPVEDVDATDEPLSSEREASDAEERSVRVGPGPRRERVVETRD